jgi:hypothetical protein
VDSQQEIRELANSERRVWILSDFKSRLFVSEEARELVHQTFKIYDQGTVMTIYVNHLEEPDTGPSR